jgi:glucokinase
VETKVFVGVDIGGTKVAAGLVDSNGEILSHERVPMISNSTAQDGLSAVLSAISKLIASAKADVAGIGICAPGPLDPLTGVVLNPPNVPCWRNFPLAESVQKQYSVPVKVDNDANAAALAETRWGAARGYKQVFYATIGTGIGTGVVFNGRIYHGRTGTGAEGGHVSVDYHGPTCPCGKRGCIEMLASGTAIARRARELISAGMKSCISELVGGDVSKITGEIVANAYTAGDSLAREILGDAAEALTVWLSSMIDVLDPDVIVIGGGGAALYSPFFSQIQARVPKITLNPRASEVPIVAARYGAEAGIAGGAALCAAF